MANGIENLFNFSSNEDALREAARRRLALQGRAVARNVAGASSLSATNPAAIARNVNEAVANERQRVSADFMDRLAAAQAADQQRAAQFVGSLLNAGVGIAGMVMPGAQAAKPVADVVTKGLTNAAASNVEKLSPYRQGMGRALGDPTGGSSQQTPADEFSQAQQFLTEPRTPAQPVSPAPSPSVQGATPPPPAQGPSPAPGTLLERDRVREDSRYLDTLQGLLMGGVR